MGRYRYIIALMIFLLPLAALARANVPPSLWVICGSLPGCGNGWGEYVSPALVIIGTNLVVYGEILAALFIMIGGGFILLSAGNAERVTKGKNTIMWAIGGIFLMKSTSVILNAIVLEASNRAPGADVIESSVNTLIITVQDLFYIALVGVAVYSGMRMAITFGKVEEFNKARDGLFYAAIGAIIINWAGRILLAFTTM
ncbi:hypothetical protein A3A67_04865 [Candidatus Peribacteria bacterium RIFCSPLOWO2_01_FULL_51_18]|nr:MAG: hypothetical protein A3C52_02545 [Candidatus Peribacteria bacterium RIFCSPHIGHO2_02_FULL_51_15]OGJ66077.1 MAG: hypothetical protein A3A67_04865 [Candidatus Peribacteria bacterium RIFCSPLOWO2_01_FULL_51_18]OGJ69885.1 MAG: hypothetical protein A3J34_03125 [Candidatus Peribacteria bacterium RIFCSPLOWO2_02_FULL_51_10]